jgi:hypothetical protein
MAPAASVGNQVLFLQTTMKTKVLALFAAAVTIDGITEYKPTSLDSVRSQLEGMRNDVADTDHRLSNTNSLVLLCLALNVVALVLLLWRRRRAA